MTDTLKIFLDSNVVHNIFPNNSDILMKILFIKNNPPSESIFNWTVLIPIIVVIIGGIITLYQVRSNTISSARIKWIENFNDIISEYCVYAEKTIIQIGNINEKYKINKEYKEAKTSFNSNSDEKVFKSEYLQDYHEYLEYISKALEYLNKIRIYLKMKDNRHKEIDDLLLENKAKTSLCFKNFSENEEKRIKDNIEKIAIISREIVNGEWKKSKSYFPEFIRKWFRKK